MEAWLYTPASALSASHVPPDNNIIQEPVLGVARGSTSSTGVLRCRSGECNVLLASTPVEST